MLVSDPRSPKTNKKSAKLSPNLLRDISDLITFNSAQDAKLPDRSQLTFDDKMDFYTIEEAAEYCRLDILSDISHHTQQYFDLIQPSDVAVYTKLVVSKDYRMYGATFHYLTRTPSWVGEPMSKSLMYHLIPIYSVCAWYSEFQEDLVKSVSPDGVFGSDNYDVGYDNNRYMFATALTYIIAEPVHTIRWIEKRFNTNRRIREIQHRCYCGAIRKILQVVDGVEVQKTHYSEPSDCATVRTYLEVHPPKKLA